MKELIKITTNEQGQKLVSARELHDVLVTSEGKQERFSQWFKRHMQYGFEENIDFTSVKIFTVVNNGAKRELDDYAMTIDMAKEMAMLQKSDKGRVVRKYFIECEKQLMNQTPQISQREQLLLQLFSKDEMVVAQAHRQLVALETKPLIEKIEEDKPKVDYHDNVLHSDKLSTITEIAKDLGMSAIKLNKTLHDLGIQYKKGKTWYLYSKHEHLVPTHFDYHITEYGQVLKVTEQGRKWIIELLTENELLGK